MRPELTPVSPGVLRVSWPRGLELEHAAALAEQVRAAAREVFGNGTTRLEAHVHPDDHAGQRVATLSGLRKEGIARGAVGGQDRIVYALLAHDEPADQPTGFRAMLNALLPRKRAIGQMLVRDPDDRVLLCQLTYKRDFDLPGGVVEVGESPRLAVAREIEEELALRLEAGPLVLTDWLPPWGGWDDAVCLVFDGGVHDPALLDGVVRQEREIRSAGFYSVAEAEGLCADFTVRRIRAALDSLRGSGSGYTESGR
ncbi:MAG TPA: NUDIX hydrolase [Marmoricola sp.]|nr:NUDIX hydrolase [Marmoricola sp.]